jgi:hypothetical protein
MSERPIDAFILFNAREDGVEPIVGQLEKRGVSTYFSRRDVSAGEDWSVTEPARLKESRTIVVFLGDSGWGPTQKVLAEDAAKQNKRLIPVLIGNPPDAAFDEVGALFRHIRYVDLRKPSEEQITQLVRSIQQPEPTAPRESPQLDGIIRTIRDGNESQRAAILEQIRYRKDLDRAALSARLRLEIQERFGPNAEANFASAIRDPKRIGAIRSWLLSCLIWTDAEDPQNREVILQHLNEKLEPDRNVRFWTLAQVCVRDASYVMDAVEQVMKDRAGEVNTLGNARKLWQDEGLVRGFRSGLNTSDFEVVWSILRALRIVAIPDLAPDVCAQLERTVGGTPLAYDALYALSNPPMAAAAGPILAQKPGVAATVDRVLDEANTSDPNAAQNFVGLLAALPAGEVDMALEAATKIPVRRRIAESIREFLANRRQGGGSPDEVLVAGYASDTIDVSQDRLDIREDVHTLTAVMLATDVKPPLAIGLFGDWGSGKSYFMQSMREATTELAASGKASFCSDIVSIEFNAWHYADTNLWASMVSYILEKLAAHVNPRLSPEQQQEALMAQLASAKAMKVEAETEKQRTEALIATRAEELQTAKMAREKKEITLRDLRASDLRTLIDGNPALKKTLEDALHTMGVPAVLDSASDLAKVVAEAGSIRGRIASLWAAVVQGKNRKVTWTLLAFVLVVIPGAAFALDRSVVQHFFVRVGGLAAEVAAFLVAAKKVLSDAFAKVKTNLGNIEAAKREVDTLLAKKREEATPAEDKLQKEIAELRAKEQQSAAQLSAAAAKVVELEARIQSAQQGRSLAQFLSERTQSDDYRKYLGLISTIRQDFDKLEEQLAAAAAGPQSRRVDRIVLYIDDLDRCSEEKVMEVLQAVHLLLAYPLFVVVVGVDPRWLLHSLQNTYQAFRGVTKPGENGDTWQTTPQNYLEKIFQIPFSLRPMTDDGYRRLMGSLLMPDKSKEDSGAKERELPRTEQTITASTEIPKTDPAPTTDASPPPQPEAPKVEPRHESPKPRFVIHEESLSITSWEAAFAERLFRLIPTPRAAKRFSNVYRILKAPVSREKLRTFEGTEDFPGEFQVPMLLLAMLTGAPAEAAEVFPAIWQAAAGGRSGAEILQGLVGLVSAPSEQLCAFQERIRPIVSDPAFPSAPDLLRDWLPRVSRFSFDVGRAIEATRHVPAAKASAAPA